MSNPPSPTSSMRTSLRMSLYRKQYSCSRCEQNAKVSDVSISIIANDSARRSRDHSRLWTRHLPLSLITTRRRVLGCQSREQLSLAELFSTMTTIVTLPTDTLALIFELLSVPTLAALSQSCRYLHFAVSAIHETSRTSIRQLAIL